VTYLWAEGEPIQVEADSRGAPHRFRWRGRAHPVDSVVRRWRIDEEWWRERIWREYFKCTTSTGLLVVVFHDLIGGEWFLQQLVD